MRQNNPTQKAERSKSTRQPKGRTSPVAQGQTPSKADARAASRQAPERPLHGYAAAVSESTEVRMGFPLPLGVHECGGGVNFAFFSRNATRVRLELLDRPEDPTPTRMIDLNPARHRTGDVWHVWVKGIRPGQIYAYRVDGPYQPKEGHRFNFNL
jgi:glycogen operon protein